MYNLFVNLKSDIRCDDIGDSTTGNDTRTKFFLCFSKTGTRATVDFMDLKI